MTDRQTTHAQGCWDWGPKHYECARREIELLVAEWKRVTAALEAAREDAERYRWLRDPCSGAERVIFYCRGDYGRGLMSSAMLDAAIDQARGKAAAAEMD